MDVSFVIVAIFVGLIVFALLGGAVFSVMRWAFTEDETAPIKNADSGFMGEEVMRPLNINIRK